MPSLAPQPKFRAFTAGSATSPVLPLVGGKLWTYEAGTTTPKPTFTDESGETPNTNPVILNARGEADVWLGEGAYKFVLTDAAGVQQGGPVDNIKGLDQWRADILDEVAPEEGDLEGLTVVVGDGITDRSAALAAAVALGRPILFVGVSVIGTATTITVPIVDTLEQIFTPASLVTIANGLPVRPEWWGIGTMGAFDLAIASLPAAGGVVQIEIARYKPSGYVYGFGGVGTGKYIAKDNLTIQGRKMPRLANDCRSLEGGSIIEGMVLAYANNIEFRDLGVDSGKTVLQTYYGNVEQPGVTEALNITYPDTATKAAAALRRQVRLHNVIGLCSSPGSLTHAIIIGEGVTDVNCTGEIVTCYGTHGAVIKCSSVRAEQISCYLSAGEALIVKTDAQATAVATDIQIAHLYVRASGPIGWSPYAVPTTGTGLLFHAAAGSVDKVQVSEAIIAGYPVCVGAVFGGAYVISSVNIGRLVTDQAGVAGTRQGLQVFAVGAGQTVSRFRVDSLEARNTSVGAQIAFAQITSDQSQNVSIGRLEVTNAENAVDLGVSAHLDIGSIVTSNLTDAVYHITGTPRLTVGALIKDTLTPAVYSAASAGLAPALANGWTQVSGNDEFGVDLLGGRVALRGLIRPGTTNTCMVLPPWARPLSAKRFVAQGYNGTTVVAVPVTVGVDGSVVVNEVGGGTANVGGASGWLSLSGIGWDQQA